ncbi:DNA-directed RNA polymerase II core subunit [Aspergillus fumigatus]
MSPKKPFMLPNEMAYARWIHATGGSRNHNAFHSSINLDNDQPRRCLLMSHSRTSVYFTNFESFVLSPGEEKVEVETDTRIPSSSIFTFNKEDHTLGNLLRSRLLQNSHVIFAGYKVCPPMEAVFSSILFEVLGAFLESFGMHGSDELSQVPHPLVPKFELRVQTDGEITPKDALLAACHDLVKDLGILSREFTKEYELRKMVGATQQQQNGTAEGA